MFLKNDTTTSTGAFIEGCTSLVASREELEVGPCDTANDVPLAPIDSFRC
jgi:hypothetical protein